MRFFHFFITASIAFVVCAQVCMTESKEHSEIVPLTKRALVVATEEDLSSTTPYYSMNHPGKTFYWVADSKRRSNLYDEA